MIEVAEKQFAEIVEKLAPKLVQPKENVGGFYDVEFCCDGECYLMISVDKSTGKVNNFWWQVNFPIDVNYREIQNIKMSCRARLEQLAEAACGFAQLVQQVQHIQPVHQIDQVVRRVQQVQQVQPVDDWASKAQAELDEKNRKANPVAHAMINDI